MTILVPLATIAADRVEDLLDRAFGPERHGRTAYRIRSGTEAVPELSFAALAQDGRLLGTVQCWPVVLDCDDGGHEPMVMVGPVAVEPDLQRGGIGRLLMHHVLKTAHLRGIPGADALMLIGDPEYYERFFGFTAEHTARWRLPGPYEQRRLLAFGTAIPVCAGVIGPRLRQSA